MEHRIAESLRSSEVVEGENLKVTFIVRDYYVALCPNIVS